MTRHRPGRAFGITWLLAFCLLLPTLSACSQVTQLVGGGGGTLRLSGDPPATLDPAMVQDAASESYMVQIFSGLVRLDNQLKVQPDLAQSWTVGGGGRVYTFHLRPDARFQDGQPITSADFVYSFNRSLDPATHSPVAETYLGDIVGAHERLANQAPSVSGVVAVDPHTLQITITSPESYFLAKLTYPVAFVVNRRNVATGPNWFQHPNGSGPFELKSWTPGNQLVLVRNPNYYGARPTLAEVDYYLGPLRPLSLFEQGKLDLAGVGQGDLPQVEDPQGQWHDQLRITPSLSVFYLGMNVNQKPFDDPKVRLAFAYATNKQLLINALFAGSRPVAHGILPPGLLGYDPSFQGIPYDPQKAQGVLAASSYGSGAALPPIVLSVSPGTSQLAEALAQMYHDNLGANVSVEVLENSFFDDLAKHRAQMFYLGWVADYPDPQDFLSVLLGAGSQANYTGYDDPAVDQLLAEASSETDVTRRTALYRQAQQQIITDAPVIPLFYDTEYDVVSPHVHGLTITPIGIISFAGVTVQG